MRGEIVAIDLETTGLDATYDAIIEVGAVRMLNGEIVEEFSTLVNPGRLIPESITQLTGIYTEDVINAPVIQAVLPSFGAFVGNATIVGHNLSFDLGFLSRYGVLHTNPRIDTYELAAVLMPRAARYNLSSLAAELGIELESAHRALDDARATAHLYWALWRKVLDLPYHTLQEIVNAAEGLDWDGRLVFEAALREHPQPTQKEQMSFDEMLIETFGRPEGEHTPLHPGDYPQPIAPQAVIALMDDASPLAKVMKNYEHRPQQLAMARLIADAFNSSQHVMIEAGTGTGKSLAYLVPAILWATTNGERVVISTNTINLQEQLIHSDIPALKQALGISFKASVMKGRGNYLCPRRLTILRRRRPTNVDEMRMLAKILVWLLESNSGDRGELNLRGAGEHIVWQRLSAEDEGCTQEQCRTAMQGVCPFYKARRAAEAAHILIVNHALLLSDVATENRVIPSYNYLILDEAHHLENAVTNGLSFSLDEFTLRRRLADLGDPKRGLLGDILKSTQAHIPDREYDRLASFVQQVSEAIAMMELHIREFFSRIQYFMRETSGGRVTDYNLQIRITSGHRVRNEFAQIQRSWEILSEFVVTISEALYHLAEALERMGHYDIPNHSDLVASAHSSARYLEEVINQLTAFTSEPDSNTVYWVSAGQDLAYPTIHAAPLHVGPLVEKHIWQAKESVILTSATLQTNGSFDYIRERLYAEAVETVAVGSPFDYRQSTLVYIPNDIPEPDDQQRYQQALERGLIELAAVLGGRVMALFTSYAQLRQTAQAIAPRLALGNITVYDQSDGSSRQALVDGFKTSEKAVLLGTKSFWEGVDIPGEALSALVIARLPFAVPSDPIFAARSETYNNPFYEYAVPDAILRFRQGFGRLIRTHTDRGVVAIFDRRVLTRGYGAHFLEALPDCTIQQGPLQTLPEVAKEWLSR